MDSISPSGLNFSTTVPLNTTSATPAMAMSEPYTVFFLSLFPFVKKWASTAVHMGAEATSMLTFDARVYLRALFSHRKYAVSAKSDMKNIPRLSTATVFSVFGYIHHSTAYATKKRISIICTGVNTLSSVLLNIKVLPHTHMVASAIRWPLSPSVPFLPHSMGISPCRLVKPAVFAVLYHSPYYFALLFAKKTVE